MNIDPLGLAAQVISGADYALKVLGAPVVISRQSVGVYNPATGEVVRGPVQTFSAFGASKNVADEEINDDTVLRGDMMITINLTTPVTTPLVNDELSYQGKTYRILNVYTTNMSGSAIVYKLHVRV